MSQCTLSISKHTGITLKLHILTCGSWRSYYHTAQNTAQKRSTFHNL